MLQVDIYSLGNIFYMLLTREWPWDDMKERNARKLVKAGKRPKLPKSLQNSGDPIDKVLMEAMHMSQVQDPNERATARQVEAFLKQNSCSSRTPMP
jgi:serine/threonine protein kinase